MSDEIIEAINDAARLTWLCSAVAGTKPNAFDKRLDRGDPELLAYIGRLSQAWRLHCGGTYPHGIAIYARQNLDVETLQPPPDKLLCKYFGM